MPAPYIPRDWKDEPNLLEVLQGTAEPTSNTPLDAPGMENLEQRLADWAESIGAEKEDLALPVTIGSGLNLNVSDPDNPILTATGVAGGTYQPASADLDALVALTLDTFGIGLLEKTNAAGVRSYIDAAALTIANTFTQSQTISAANALLLTDAAAAIKLGAASDVILGRYAAGIAALTGILISTGYINANFGGASAVLAGYDADTAAAGPALSVAKASGAVITAIKRIGDTEVGTGTGIKMSGYGLDARDQKVTNVAFGTAADDAVTRDQLDAVAQSFLRPTGSFRETFRRPGAAMVRTIAAPVSGRLELVAIPLLAGEVVTTITFFSGSTASASQSNLWAALYDGARAKLAVSDDKTTNVWAADSAKTFTLSSPYTVLTSGLYYLGLLCVATTMPTLAGVNPSSQTITEVPILYGVSTTGLTNPASAPNPAAAIGGKVGYPWAYVS